MKRVLVVGWATGLCWLGASAAEPPLWRQPGYSEAILKARAGDPGPALEWLEQQRQQGPLSAPLWDDYLTLLVWSGRGAEALRLLAGDEAELSADTLERLARAARDQRARTEAVRLYQLLVSRFPTTAVYRAGLALAQAEDGQADVAVSTLNAVQPATPTEELEWLRARAYVALQADDLFFALDLLQRAREHFANDRELDRLYLSVLLRLKLPDEARGAAQRMAHRDPALDWQIESDRAAVLSRWGRIEESLGNDPQRFRQTDAALALNAGLSAAPLSADTNRARVLEDDRMQMMQQRGDAAQVVALGRQRAETEWSPYARAALADAYLALRQPERAVGLYRSALAQLASAQRPLDWHEGLVYALLESGQYDACRAHLDILRAEVPRTVRDAAGRLKFNPQFQRVELLLAMVTAFMDEPRAAWDALEALRRDAPANAALRQSRGAVALMRGWPRRARDIYTRVLVDDPEAVEPHAGLAAAALDLNDVAAAQAHGRLLQQRNPQANSTQSLQARILQAQRPQLVFDVARESGNDQGAHSAYAWDTGLRWYSSSQGHWRVLASHSRQQAGLVEPAQVARFEQLGLGLQHRSERGNAEGGVTAQTVPRARQGVFAAYEWTPDDHWAVSLRLDTDSADVPLKGRLTDTQGRAWQGAVTYRVDESRSLGARAEVLALSDGNRRRSWSAHWEERWASGPRYQFGTQVGVSASRNDHTPSAGYFNPGRDASWWLNGIGEWPLAGRYETRWSLRAAVTVGGYWQQRYGSAGVRSATVEVAWRGPRGAEWRAGWSRVRHPYDGVVDASGKVFMHWERRF